MDIVTMARLNSALSTVISELDSLGFYDPPMDAIDVCLVPIGLAHGYQGYGGTGEI